MRISTSNQLSNEATIKTTKLNKLGKYYAYTVYSYIYVRR